MDCKYKETLIMYFYRELDDDQKQDFSRHLSECIQCQSDLMFLKNISEFLNITQKEPSLEVVSTLMQKVHNIREKFSITDIYEFLKIRWRQMALTLACASVLLVFVKMAPPVKNGNLGWSIDIENQLDSIEYEIYEFTDDISEELLSDFDFKYIKLKSEIQNQNTEFKI